MKSSELLRLLKRAGWKEVRQTGSHIILDRDGKRLIFPNHGSKEMATGTEKAIRKQGGV